MIVCCFFFQAEDGIRDDLVTGVQTCALPISLTVRIRQNLRVSGGSAVERDWTTWSADCRAEILAGEILANALACSEEKELILVNGATQASAKLIAAKILQRFPIRGVSGKRFGAEVLESAAMDVIRSRLGDDVDYSSCRASEFSVSAACHHLELFHRIHCDVDRGALTTFLLSKESVVVVAAVQADIIKDSALTVEVDLVPVRTLGN